MKPFSIIFCGTPSFACPSLKALAASDAFDVRLVITQPDRPAGRKNIPTPPPVKLLAQELTIPLWQPEKLNKEFDQMPEASCDFLVVVAYGQIISQKVLDFPRIAPVNVHASVLPRWRGAAPMQWSILAGDAEGGVTVQRMVRELDAGPVLATAAYPLSDRTTIQELHDALADVGATLLTDTLAKPLNETAQDESKVTVCTKFDRSIGECDPRTMEAVDIDRKVRALVPWPGVTCPVFGEEVKLIETGLEAGNDSFELACANDTVLHVHRLQSPGKRIMTGSQWLRGRQKD